MRYATAAAFRTALEQRLLTLARQQDVPLVRLRKLVAFERLLARLMVVAPDRWVLKGAVALHYRLGARFRTTKDLDLGRWDDERVATDDLLATERVALGDYFRFAVERTAKLDELLEGAAVRYHVTSYLAGRRFEELILDVGFGGPLPGEPERLRGPDLLGFAGIEATEVPALPLESHVAEKVHAYTRSYAGGRTSTRVKDLVDLVLIPSLFAFEAGRLRSALDATFGVRGTHPVPTALPPPPAGWRAGYRRLAAEIGLDPEMAVGYAQGEHSLIPSWPGPLLTMPPGTRPDERGRRACCPRSSPRPALQVQPFRHRCRRVAVPPQPCSGRRAHRRDVAAGCDRG